MQVSPLLLLLFTEASRTGWGAHLQYLTTTGVWREEQINQRINILEIKAFHLALTAFRDWIIGEFFVLMSGNATKMAYIKKHGDSVSRVMYYLA